MRRALAVAALSCTVSLGLLSAPALAGPGVQLISDSDSDAVRNVTGAEIAGNADVPSRSYTLRSRSGSRQLRLTGLSIRGLLQRAGFNPDTVEFISIVRDDGSLATLRRADFAGSPEGPALVTDEGSQTRFFRPVRGPGTTNARDNIVSTGRLDMTVGGGALLTVRASASPRRTAVGRTVRFRASVHFAPPGASFTYRWDFGDGTSGSGASVTHRYDDEGDFQAQVTVEGTGGTGAVCQQTCGGVAKANVRIGKGRTSPRPGTQPGSGNANPNGSGAGGTGSGAGGSGTGSGGSQGSDDSSDPGAGAGRGEPAPRADAGASITGVLLANSATALRSSLPALRSAGAQTPAGRAAREGAQGGGMVGGSIALTMALVVLGALYERRRGTLRLA